jgi:hypothetical protein
MLPSRESSTSTTTTVAAGVVNGSSILSPPPSSLQPPPLPSHEETVVKTPVGVVEKTLKGYEERWSKKKRLEWDLENTPFFRDGIYLLKAVLFQNEDENEDDQENTKNGKNKNNITLRITYTYQYSWSKFFSVFVGLSSVSEGIRTLWTFLDKHCLCKECGALLNKDIQEEEGCPSCEMFVGFSAFLEKQEDCAICLEPVHRLTLPCGHKFHKLCMNSVRFEGHRNCPLCRADIPYDVLCSIYDFDNVDLGNEEEEEGDDDSDDDDNEEEE